MTYIKPRYFFKGKLSRKWIEATESIVLQFAEEGFEVKKVVFEVKEESRATLIQALRFYRMDA